MANIKAKYLRYRRVAKTGDTILVRSVKPLGRLISLCDGGYYTHVMSCEWVTRGTEQRLEILESGLLGPDTGFLSKHILEYVDFFVLRPRRSEGIIKMGIDYAVNKAEIGMNYGYKIGTVALFSRLINRLMRFLGRIIGRKLNAKTSFSAKDKGVICTQFEALRLQASGIYDYRDLNPPFPQDYLRFLNLESMEIVKF